MSLSWKSYYKNNDNYYNKISRLYRKIFFASEGKIYTDKHFLEEGFFVECGSGTSECSVMIQKKKRYGIAVDIRVEPLRRVHAPIMESLVQGTIFNLPFKDGTVNGIWNFGVMEHFKENDLKLILKEFNRTLSDDGKIVLFWPWAYSPLSLFFILRGCANIVISKFGGKLPRIYPDAFTVFKNKSAIKNILKDSGFSNSEFELSPYGLFVHYVVIASK